MTAPTIAPDDYLDRVRLALGDLPAADRDDLLEDLQGHLEELRAEDPSLDLLRRLGDPTEYALELRLAAGLPPGEQPLVRPTVGERLVRSRAAAGARVRALPLGAATLDFLVQLRPAWWLVRAYGAVVVLDAVLRRARRGSSTFDTLAPSLHRSRELGLVAMVVLAAVSVAVGRRRLTGTARVMVVLANVVLAVATVAHVHSASRYQPYERVSQQLCCGELYGPQGDPITNLYGYDENGTLIPRVQLFDQNGQPVNVTSNAAPGSPIEVLHNVFPQQTFNEQFGPDGTPTFAPQSAPSIAAPRLPSAAPTPSPTPPG
jgi:uncharacterized membrane protein